MDINITAYFTNDLAPMDFSASVAEIGNNAGRDTWSAAIEESADLDLLDTEEKRIAARAYFQTFGAWDSEEVNAWTNTELNALLIQCISGDIREASEYLEQSPVNWAGYAADENKGGNMYQGTDNEIYYYMGS